MSLKNVELLIVVFVSYVCQFKKLRPKFDQIPEHIHTNSLMREREVGDARLERAAIAVCIREDNDVVRPCEAAGGRSRQL